MVSPLSEMRWQDLIKDGTCRAHSRIDKVLLSPSLTAGVQVTVDDTAPVRTDHRPVRCAIPMFGLWKNAAAFKPILPERIKWTLGTKDQWEAYTALASTEVRDWLAVSQDLPLDTATHELVERLLSAGRLVFGTYQAREEVRDKRYWALIQAMRWCRSLRHLCGIMTDSPRASRRRRKKKKKPKSDAAVQKVIIRLYGAGAEVTDRLLRADIPVVADVMGELADSLT